MRTIGFLVYLLGMGAWALQAAPLLTHRYSFESDARDTVGGADGQLVGGATISNGAVTLDGASGYVNLPNNLVAGYAAITLEMWVTDNGSSAWARLYDFGNSTGGEDFPLGAGTQGTQYMFLTPRSGAGTLRGSYTITGGGSGEQIVEWPGTALPVGVRKHVIWASDAASAWLYVDGVLVGSNNAVTLSPAALGPTVNNWLGRSQWNDPLFRGSIQEFRVYNGALGALQIAVNETAGPDLVVTNPGLLQAVSLSVSPLMYPGASQTLVLLGQFANVTNVPLTGLPGVAFHSSDTNVLSVDASGHLQAVGSGLATVTATYLGVSDTQAVQVVAPPQTLIHRYSFTTDASDSEAAANGTLAGGAAVANGAVNLNGTTAYVDLPNNLVTGLTSVSFEAWFTDSGSSTWARLWDFGNSSGGENGQGAGIESLFLAEPGNAGGAFAAIQLQNNAAQTISLAARPSLGVRHHLVWTLDGAAQSAKLYFDGLLAGQNDNVSITPSAMGSTVNNWLGRSQYYDPFFYGSIDEFRLYRAALTPQEVAQDYQLGPDLSPQSVPVSITAQPQSIRTAEDQPVIFSVQYVGRRPVTFQWFRNGLPIPGATNADYRLASPLPTDSGSTFSVALTNQVGNTTCFTLSSNAALTVLPDVTRPTVTRCYNVGTTNVVLVFSEALEASSATDPQHYAFTNGLPITAVTLAPDQLTVFLTTAPLVLGSNYVVVVNGLRDRAFTPNLISSNTTVGLVAWPYTSQDLGGALPPGQFTSAGNGFDLTAGGGDIGGTSDQCSLNYQSISGDFDLQVRLQGLTSVDAWAKAGLMARESLEPGSPFVAALATPGLQGSFLACRSAVGTRATASGSFPPNLPNTWLRLQRAGDLFTGYASYDGQTWTPLGSVSLVLPSTLYVGFALASHANGSAVTAQFRDLGPTIRVDSSPFVVNPSEPLGPSSRRTPIAISEIMYKPARRSDGRNTEFIELFNSNPWPHDLSGYRVAGLVQYTFPPQTTIPAGGFLVLAAAPADLQSTLSDASTPILGPYTNSLKTSGSLKLYDEAGALLLDLDYSDAAPWPMGADGTGHSIVLARPSYGEADPRAWSRSERPGGSPGTFESYQPSPLRNVLLNEVLAHTDPPDIDTIELYNHGNSPVDLSGCSLSDNPATNKFVFATNTIIPARGFIAVIETQLGFGLNAAGETIYFKAPSPLAPPASSPVSPAPPPILDALRFDAQENGVSFGRYPDGADQWYRLSAKTLGTNNAAPLFTAVGINEIMYHPISDNEDDQYVELFNRGAQAINLAGWKFVAGISYTFPTNAIIPPQGFLVVAHNLTRLLTNYPYLSTLNPQLSTPQAFGNFSGRLSGAGERLALAMPDTIVTTNVSGFPVTNYLDIVVDEVTFGTGGRWGQWADGGGSSLELIDPRADKRLAANWADSDETAKSVWTNIEASGVLDNGANYDPAIDYAQIGLLESGECLVDNIEVRPGTAGANYVANPGFENGLANWLLLGDHSRSSLEPGAGYSSSGNALHLRTADRIWSGANAAQVTLTNTSLAAGQTATLRFKARWLHGCPEVLLRLSGNWLEATGRLPVPANLGTPGLSNSRAVPNAGPAIYEVTHSPSLPAANQPVVVTARVSVPSGLGLRPSDFRLRYRLDPSTTYVEVPLRDDGSGGDAVAGDGLFSASIPGQPAGSVVAFILVATNSAGAGSRFPALRNDNAPDRECIVAFGDPNPPSSFGAYHLWLTRTNLNRWIALPVLSNEAVDGTLVYGNRVIYNMGGRYGGSPYHQSFDSPMGNNACHYNWSMPKDDLLLGASSFNKIAWPGNDIQDDSASQNVNDATLQREQTANTFLRALGVPWINRRYVAVFVNGHRRGNLMEDALRPSVSVKDEYFPNDTGGLLYKFQPWFEFAFNPSGNYMPWANQSWCLFMPYTTTGGAYKTARYRWSFELRETPDSLNNYTHLFSLITAGSAWTQPNYVSALENVADMDNWMRLVAANHAAGNWDCWGINNEQNIYGYVSPQQRWTLFMFDMNIVLGNRISWGPGSDLFTVNGNDSNWQHIYSTPKFRRMYWRALKELVNGPMQTSAVNPLVEAKYAAFVADGLTVQHPVAIESWVAQARASIASQLAAEDTAAFALNASTLAASSNTITLSGAAPVEVTTLSINGQTWAPTWTSVTGWTLRLPVPNGSSSWTVVAYDRFGHMVGGTNRVIATNSALPDSPVGNVVFSELMFNPSIGGAEYVELFNRSTNTTFDLSGWQINGLGYTFPSGSTIAPRNYLVLAGSRISFAAAYGPLVPIFDEFSGSLQMNGETLSLLAPSSLAPQAPLLLVDRVRYETVAPWPMSAATRPGTALQLVDLDQDNSRVGNWSVGLTNPAPSLQWVYVWTNIPAASSRLYLYLQSAGDIYLDDVTLVAGTVPESGTNRIANGDFESALTPNWNLTSAFTQSALSTAVKHAGNSSLHLVATAAGSGGNNAIYQEIAPALVTNATYTLSFWYLQSPNGGPLTVRLSSSTTPTTLNPAPALPRAAAGATPGASNAVAALLPAFPSLWLNEVQPQNLTGPTDNFGERDPWLEIFNPGSNTVSLTGLYLGTNYASPNQWTFPPGTSLAPGQFLTVWADGQPQQATGGVLHTSFRLSPGPGTVALSRMVSNALQIVDYLTYPELPANYAYGDVPDGQPFYRQAMYRATPGASNNAALPPLSVCINEWMAENTGFMTDPGTGKYDDWFELYNPSDTAADLAGYYLTDTLTNQFQFQIPAGYRVPAHGFLLVWADGKASANSSNSPDLHVNFKLDKGGEAIGLFTPEGSAIDAVLFGPQIPNQTEGRYPDGARLRLLMPTPSPRAPNLLPPASAPPTVSGMSLQADGRCSLTFQTSPGHTYRVEFKDNLSSPAWTPLSSGQTATGSSLSISDNGATPSQRFYRIVMVN